MSARSLLAWTGVIVLLLSSVLGTARARNEADAAPDLGPTTVVLRELEDVYEPVPFDHLGHAKMAEMWNGCTTCHHQSPHPTDHTNFAEPGTIPQNEAAEIPACKSCHPVDPAEATIEIPGLKGAYHRQCLNCHQDWMHENACVICHAPKEGADPAAHEPSPGDIIGRMHPPIPEPDFVLYKARFTPAAGPHVLFGHRTHTHDHELRCVSCHVEDNCTHCHGTEGDTSALKPIKPGMTWNESHQPCISCHQEDTCRDCHYRDGENPPRSELPQSLQPTTAEAEGEQ